MIGQLAQDIGAFAVPWLQEEELLYQDVVDSTEEDSQQEAPMAGSVLG